MVTACSPEVEVAVALHHLMDIILVLAALVQPAMFAFGLGNDLRNS